MHNVFQGVMCHSVVCLTVYDVALECDESRVDLP